MTTNLIGQMLSQYAIESEIGAGGMATVYKAYQAPIDRHVAVKVLDPQLAQDSNFVKRFEQEAKAVAALEHPHILPLYDFGYQNQLIYMVMRYVEGGTLADMLEKNSPLPDKRIAEIINDLSSALDYAHKQGLVHRDIKPSNILIGPQGEVMLTDFGLVKAIHSSREDRLTETGIVYGTPDYMSPEQAMDHPVDGRTDIYSLGIILYELLTGMLPFKATTPMALALKHIKDPIPPPRTVKPDMSPDVEAVVFKAMAKKPDDRYQTAGEMATALNHALYGSETAPMPQADTTTIVVQKRSWPIKYWIGGTVVLIILGMSLWSMGYNSATNNVKKAVNEGIFGSGERGTIAFEERFDDNRAGWFVGKRDGFQRVYEATLQDNRYRVAVIEASDGNPYFWLRMTEEETAHVSQFLSQRGEDPAAWLTADGTRIKDEKIDAFVNLVTVQSFFTADTLTNMTLDTYTVSADMSLEPNDDIFAYALTIRQESNIAELGVDNRGTVSIYLNIEGKVIDKSASLPKFDPNSPQQLHIQIEPPVIRFLVNDENIAITKIEAKDFATVTIGFNLQRATNGQVHPVALFDNVTVTQP